MSVEFPPDTGSIQVVKYTSKVRIKGFLRPNVCRDYKFVNYICRFTSHGTPHYKRQITLSRYGASLVWSLLIKDAERIEIVSEMIALTIGEFPYRSFL
jgi:hypothetical protein